MFVWIRMLSGLWIKRGRKADGCGNKHCNDQAKERCPPLPPQQGTVPILVLSCSLSSCRFLSNMSEVLSSLSGCQGTRSVRVAVLLFAPGEERLHRALHPQQDADQADPSHLQQDQQIHLRLPEHRGRLRNGHLPRDQPG